MTCMKSMLINMNSSSYDHYSLVASVIAPKQINDQNTVYFDRASLHITFESLIDRSFHIFLPKSSFSALSATVQCQILVILGLLSTESIEKYDHVHSWVLNYLRQVSICN